MAKEVKGLSSWFQKTKSDFKREREARRRSREIDVMLKRTSQEPVVIYLCGQGQCGKTTFLKQMRIIHGPEFSHQELLTYRRTVYQNILWDIQALLKERNRLGIPWQNAANETHELLVNSVVTWKMDSEPQTFQRYADAITSLWKDSGIKEAYSRCEITHFSGPYVKYFFDNMDRIGQLSYVPCHQDILYTRTHLCWEQLFVFRNIMIVGCPNRQRHGRVFNNVLLFIASNDYGKTFVEEENWSDEGNSLGGSVSLFKYLLKARLFLNSTVILFLNKTDLLAEKVKTVDIRQNFPEFSGDPHSLEEVQEFMVQCFRQNMENDTRPFYHHFTTAVDTENIRTAFDSVKDTIMSRNLNKLKFL